MSTLQLFLPALIGVALLGGVAGVIGSFSVLRRRALMGDLLSHAALPGLCAAFLIVGERRLGPMLFGAFLSGLLALGLVTLVCRWTRTKEDAAIGIMLSTFFGAGIVLASLIQRQPSGGSKAGLQTFIYGSVAGINVEDVWGISIVSVVAIVVILLLYKEFKVFSFDPGFAEAQGWPTLTLDLVMMGVLALVTIIGLPAVGVVLMAAMLITPGATARFWTNQLGVMLVLSAVIGMATGVFGVVYASGAFAEWTGLAILSGSDLPAGPLVVLSGTVIFLFSMFFAPRRGIVARAVTAFNVQRKTARENLLRTLYELSEPRLPGRPAISRKQLTEDRAWTGTQAARLVRQSLRAGWVERAEGDSVRLTETGLREAFEVTRRHRLWELFLIQGASIAPDHVDRDADAIEHLLTPEIVADLEATLLAQGRLPTLSGELPRSPHELSTPSARSLPSALSHEANR